jgi:phosphopantothenoylcysteine decarboxylase/phosphopantothenate--cysteine ligase
MGYAIAEAAVARGAEVSVVAANTTVKAPTGINLISVNSAEEMHEKVMGQLGNATVFIAAAAVADYKPIDRASQKLKKSDASIALKLERTRDILREASAAQTESQLIIGFAAETENVIANAKQKLLGKHLDAVVANDVTRTDSGFDSNDNLVTILTKDEQVIELPLMSKIDVAQKLLDQVVRLRKSKLGKTQTA